MSRENETSSWVKERLPVKWAEGFQLQGNAPVQEDYLELNPQRGIFLLADGFGGSAGKLAAEITVKSVRQFLEQEAGDLDATLPFEIRPYYSLAGNVLFNAVSFANQKLMKLLKGKTWMESGGASLIAGYMDGKLLALANVGACSAVLHRGGRSKEMITPKTLARQTNPFDDADEEGKFIPLMSFGTAKQLEPEITEIEIRPGDQICFKTAGISSAFQDSLFALSKPGDLSRLTDSYATEANASAVWIGF